MVGRILRHNIVSLWINWQFFDAPGNILLAWKNFLRFNLEYFSIPILVRTFFSPWHRYRMFFGRRFDPRRYFEAFVFNSMSRSIGALLRLFFIIFGLLAEVVIVFAGPIILLSWLVLPLLLALWLLFSAWLLPANITFALIAFFLWFAAAFSYLKKFFNSKIKKTSKKAQLNFILSRALLSIKGTPFHNVADKDQLLDLAQNDLSFQRFLTENNLKPQDVENLVKWLESLEKEFSERKKFWEWENLIKMGSLAKTWTAGYTITLDRFSRDLTLRVRKQGYQEMVGHKKEIERMERVLSKRESGNNVLIVGESGSGRKSMVYELAKKSALGQSSPGLNYKRVVQLDVASLLAQAQSTEEVETILDAIFSEALLAGNIILVIDEFHNFVGGAARPGVIDVSAIISKYLRLPEFQIVAITTPEGLHRKIEQNSSLLSLFGKVELDEISEQDTLILIQKMALRLEYKYKKLFISYPSLSSIIALSAKYLRAVPFPEKAIDLLDETAVYVLHLPGKEKVILPEHVAKVVRDKTKIPVGEIEKKEREVLLNLESAVHERIINQEEAVKEISTALRRARAQITVRNGPMGVFLFLGPTGVGKTETSKALAEIYFGSEERMIRMDMSEFQNVGDIPRLIGSSGQEGLLTTPVRSNPFSLILLDELEKAHSNILNLFLQVFDEGHLTDGLGRKVDFRNAIIIATSNAGYQIILEALRQNTEWHRVKEKILNYLFSEGTFKPEFINRFDGVVIFKPLSKENLFDIAQLLLQKLNKNLKEKGIELVITEELKRKIVDLGYSPVFGAREMRRTLQDKVENVLAQAILSGELTRGSRAEIDPETFELKVNT